MSSTILAVIVALGLSLAGNYIMYGSLQDTKKELTEIKNDMESIRKSQEIQDKEIKVLVSSQSAISNQARSLNNELKDLKVQNAEVKSYLEQPVPSDVGRLLNSAKATDK